MKHYEYEINLLLDGELNNSEQMELFEHLSQCNICREQYAEYLQLKNRSKNVLNKNITAILAEDVKTVPNKVVTLTPRKINPIIYKIGFYTSAAAAVLLFFLLTNHKPEINYLAGAQVRVDTVFVPKEKIVYKTVEKQIKNINPEANQRSYIKYLASLPEKQLIFVDSQIKPNEEKQ